MRRILTRPMFRSGGQARPGYANGKSIIDDIAVTEDDITKYTAQQPPRSPDNSLNDFLINFGLDLVSRSPQGNIFQTAAQSAQAPFAQMQKVKYAQDQAERDEYNDMIKTIMTAKASALGSDGGSKMFAKQSNDAALTGLMNDLFTLKANQNKEDTALSATEYAQQESILLQRLQAYTGKNPAVASLFGNKDQADLVIKGIQKTLTESEEEITIINAQGEEEVVTAGDYYLDNPGKLAEKTTELYLGQYNTAVKQSLGLAQGGMIDETMTEEVAGPGGMAMASETIEEPITDQGSGLSFEELRARLPREISDDIINILVESPAALVDFAEIQTQMDVDQFNMKYGVNLALPSGA